MATLCNIRKISFESQQLFLKRQFHISSVCGKNNVAARYKPTPRQTKPLTYEMANPPHQIAHRKSWNSWNTSNVVDGNRPAETLFEDAFIRRFVTGTFPGILASEVIIKRQHNLIRIAFIITQNLNPSKVYFLIGYTEDLLGYWLQCQIKLEIQTVQSKDNVIYKYI